MSKLRAGDWVEVRSKEEILRTLDKTGRLDDLPFMPQMFQHCGQRFKVFKRAHKTCDTIVGIPPGRRMPDGIHLNLRCDGKAYGGCQAACLIYWKETWLKSVNEGERPAPRAAGTGGCSEEDVERATRVDELKVGGEPRYACQATEVLNFTTPLPWWDARQYVEDYTSGNTTLLKMLRGFLYVGYFYGTLAFSQRFGGPARWLYDRFQTLWGGFPFPRHRGTLSAGQPEPRASLNLQPGDWVRTQAVRGNPCDFKFQQQEQGNVVRRRNDAVLRPHVSGQGAGGEIHRRKDRLHETYENAGGHPRGCDLQEPLQQPPYVLPARHLFLVARNLAGACVSRPSAADRRGHSRTSPMRRGIDSRRDFGVMPKISRTVEKVDPLVFCAKRPIDAIDFCSLLATRRGELRNVCASISSGIVRSPRTDGGDTRIEVASPSKTPGA